MNLKIKRVYDEPSADDGMRILVDRMWPRGIKKADLKMDAWEKDLAPSTELRKWYGHDPAKYDKFRTRYFEELDNNIDAADFINRIRDYDGPVTLLFAAKDTEHSNAVVLSEWLSYVITIDGIRVYDAGNCDAKYKSKNSGREAYVSPVFSSTTQTKLPHIAV